MKGRRVFSEKSANWRRSTWHARARGALSYWNLHKYQQRGFSPLVSSKLAIKGAWLSSVGMRHSERHLSRETPQPHLDLGDDNIRLQDSNPTDISHDTSGILYQKSDALFHEWIVTFVLKLCLPRHLTQKTWSWSSTQLVVALWQF
jgi:hypothetical protein